MNGTMGTLSSMKKKKIENKLKTMRTNIILSFLFCICISSNKRIFKLNIFTIEKNKHKYQ